MRFRCQTSLILQGVSDAFKEERGTRGEERQEMILYPLVSKGSVGVTMSGGSEYSVWHSRRRRDTQTGGWGPSDHILDSCSMCSSQ